MPETLKDWDLIIKPKNRLFDLKLKRVWKYRDLLWLLVRRDFIAFYKQTVLGPLWFLIQPIFIVGVYVFLFGTVARISTGEIPMPLFYLSGILTWTYFSETLLKTSSVFRDNIQIFSKVYFPRLIMPLSILFSNLLRFFAQLLLFSLLLIYYKIKGFNITIGFHIFLFPFALILLAMLALGFGLMVSALTTKYRDFAMLVTFSISIFMYACPVVYPIEALPALAQKIVKLNPLTQIIQLVRFSFFNSVSIDWTYVLFSVLISILVLLSGLIIFNRVEKNFIDTI
ncbi:MAG: ABC transporter permease [Sphingobacteriia bacterium]